jgi:hypothetical protein
MADSKSALAFAVSNTSADSDGIYTLRIDPETGRADEIAVYEREDRKTLDVAHSIGFTRGPGRDIRVSMQIARRPLSLSNSTLTIDEYDPAPAISKRSLLSTH